MKRSLDIIVSLFALLFLSPILLITSLVLLFTIGRPILFIQKRPGMNEVPFNMIKFRSMSTEKNIHGDLLADQERITAFGNFIRKTSIDELPELINVLKGDMSLVGPRPLLHEYLPLYSEKQRKRHDVRPGITGLAQIRGRNLVSWERKFKLDTWYVRNRSLYLDLKILYLTFKKVIMREGISSQDGSTPPKFQGAIKS